MFQFQSFKPKLVTSLLARSAGGDGYSSIDVRRRRAQLESEIGGIQDRQIRRQERLSDEDTHEGILQKNKRIVADSEAENDDNLRKRLKRMGLLSE